MRRTTATMLQMMMMMMMTLPSREIIRLKSYWCDLRSHDQCPPWCQRTEAETQTRKRKKETFVLTFAFCIVPVPRGVPVRCLVATVIQGQTGNNQLSSYWDDLHFVGAAVSQIQVVDGQSSSFVVDLTATWTKKVLWFMKHLDSICSGILFKVK